MAKRIRTLFNEQGITKKLKNRALQGILLAGKVFKALPAVVGSVVAKAAGLTAEHTWALTVFTADLLEYG